jgi:hypothetical protein
MYPKILFHYSNINTDSPVLSFLLLLIIYLFIYLAQQPQVGQDLLIHEVSRSHSRTHHSQ